ncbi:MAG: transcriptional regulator NrdR [Gammaproteobacteria bacterium]
MHCPFCDHADTQVIETRESEEGDSIRRRRRCLACEKRFTTYERIELSLPAVIKRNGTRSEFDRRKLRASLSLALRKRPVGADAVDAAIQRIEAKVLGLGAREVASEQIGELVMDELRKLDKIAYVRFASVYRKFEDVGEFADAVLEVQARRRPGEESRRPGEESAG